MVLPRFLHDVVVAHNLRSTPGYVKRPTPTSCGVLHKEHYIERNYSHLQQLNEVGQLGSAVPFPRAIHRLSASSRQAFHRVLHRAVLRDSLGNSLLLHRIQYAFSCANSTVIHCRFSSAFSCVFREKRSGLSRERKGRKRGGILICGKLGARRSEPLHLGVGRAHAHRMWHVEQFSARTQ